MTKRFFWSFIPFKVAFLLMCLTMFTFLVSGVSGDEATYEYDKLGRLIKVIYTNGPQFYYYYDKAGNRIEKQVDDHGNDASSATHISLNTDVSGNIGFGGNEDFFKFHAIAGNEYTIETILGSLHDSYIYLYATDGVTVLAWDDNSGPGLASKIVWACNSSGYYYIKVRAYSGSQTGTYTVRTTGPAAQQVPATSPIGFLLSFLFLLGLGAITMKKNNISTAKMTGG